MGPERHRGALPIVSVAAVLLLVPSAWAMEFDFASFANGSLPPSYSAQGDLGLGLQNVPQGEAGYYAFAMTNPPGITVTATPNPLSWYDNSPDHNRFDFYVYLDASDSNGQAGMGVCHKQSCAGNSDDNVTEGEGLWLQFSEPVKINTIQFQDQNHEVTFPVVGGGSPYVWIEGNQVALSQEVVLQQKGTDFHFAWGNSDFYIEKITFDPVSRTPAPEPATLGLLGAGLLGLVARSRRRRS